MRNLFKSLYEIKAAFETEIAPAIIDIFVEPSSEFIHLDDTVTAIGAAKIQLKFSNGVVLSVTSAFTLIRDSHEGKDETIWEFVNYHVTLQWGADYFMNKVFPVHPNQELSEFADYTKAFIVKCYTDILKSVKAVRDRDVQSAAQKEYLWNDVRCAAAVKKILK